MSIDPSPDPSVAELLARPRPVTWLFAGDSITQGAKYTFGQRDYTQLFKERLWELGRYEDVVINTAVSGVTSAWFAERFEERALRFGPDGAFLMFGTNDAAGGPGALGPFGGACERMVRELRSAGAAAVVLQTPTPIHAIDVDRFIDSQWGDEPARTEKRAAYRNRVTHLETFVAEARRLAEQLHCPLVDHWSAWHERAGRNHGPLLDGAVHPNALGHRLMAHTLLRRLGLWSDASWTCRLFVPVN